MSGNCIQQFERNNIFLLKSVLTHKGLQLHSPLTEFDSINSQRPPSPKQQISFGFSSLHWKRGEAVLYWLTLWSYLHCQGGQLSSQF